jgi:hypothetical protein
MTSAASLKLIRLTHRYLGLFFAPTILYYRWPADAWSAKMTESSSWLFLERANRASNAVP